MTTNEILAGVLAIVIAYLLGSFPSAYLITRRVNGGDIRQIGWGNVGGANVYREVSPAAGIAVIIVDIAKGAAATAIAYRIFELPQLLVVLAGLVAVGGHQWMVFLRFRGGGGLATSLGVISSVLLIYGYWVGLVIFAAVLIASIMVTHNVHVSAQLSFFLLPLIVWLRSHSLLLTMFSIALGLIMGLKFFPRLKGDLAKAGTLKNYIFHNSFRKAGR